jgi:endonuclease/exonuclease/phosphatase (EEP) superfamily protein YafD
VQVHNKKMVTSSDEQRFFHVMIRVVLVAVSLGTVLALFSHQFWFAELFSHFRLYYLLAQALLVLIFLHTRHGVLLALTVLLSVPNALPVVPYLTPLIVGRSVAALPEEQIAIIAMNVNYRSSDYQSTLNYLASRPADVIVVSEYTPAWESALAVLDSTYPYRIGESRLDPWGLAVFSRLPFVSAELVDLGVKGSVHAHVVLDLEGSPLEIFAVHLMVPVTQEKAGMRNTQFDALAAIMSLTKNPRMLVGDMNITPFSPLFDDFLGATGLVDARRPFGFHITWPTTALPIWIPVDHCLADPSIPVVNVQQGPQIGSDHFPLEITVQRPGSG